MCRVVAGMSEPPAMVIVVEIDWLAGWMDEGGNWVCLCYAWTRCFLAGLWWWFMSLRE